jgi:beta-lactamase regulating signal transducer with metallopeptidase domain/uncharacterized protein YjiS (DUF1127 family)
MDRFTPLFETFGWAVLHSLWQGALIIGFVIIARRLAGPSRPGLSYAAGLVGLLTIFFAFIGTLVLLLTQSAGIGGLASTDVLTAFAPLQDAGVFGGNGTTIQSPVGGEINASPGGASFSWSWLMPALGGVWAVGFFILSLQCMYAWAKTRCYATLGLSEAPLDWVERFESLVKAAGARSNIQLKISALVESPVTLGTFKPLVLVPAGFLSGFPPAQVEAILLHEIAHIRRHDYLIGLVQTAIRTTLYFNPAVLIISRWIDEDREQACDDFAVQRTGRPLDLAKGLAALRLSLAPQPVMAAKKGSLMARLERLSGRRASVRGLDKASAVAMAAVLLGSTVWVSNSLAHPHTPEAPNAPDANLEDTVIRAESVDTPFMPSSPTVSIPPIPMVDAPRPPAPPAISFDPLDPESSADFEARMEKWGEEMEAWGEKWGEAWEEKAEREFEDWGDAFESAMESWADQYETRVENWAEGVESRGEVIEELSDLSDTRLSEMGLSRSDVELLAEDFGLEVAGQVVGGLFGDGEMGAEARAEIAQERAALDANRLAAIMSRVEAAKHTQKQKDQTFYADRDAFYAARNEAYVERNAAYAMRNEAYKRRDQAYKLRDKARTEAEKARAKRAVADAQREAEIAAKQASQIARTVEARVAEMEREFREIERQSERDARVESRSVTFGEFNTDDKEKSVDAQALNKTLMTRLKADGLIPANATRYVMKSSEDWTKVDGRKLSREQHKAYRALLADANVCGDADFEIDVKGKKLELKMKDGRSTTRMTINP